MAAQCYICKKESEPRYCCEICGGLFCADHGTRSDKRSICQNCILDDIKVSLVKTNQMLTYLKEVRGYLERKKEECKEMEPLFEELKNFFEKLKE